MSEPLITMLIGLPGTGKSHHVSEKFAGDGTVVLSRDKEGGQVASLLPKLEKALSDGARHVVLDCTFVDATSRAPFVAAARQRQVPIEAVFFDAAPEIAQFNICWRMCERYGKVLRTKADYEAAKKDPNMFPPPALFSMLKKVEKPGASEGFHRLTVVEVRRWKLPPRFCNAAVMIDYDGTVRDTKSGLKYPVVPGDVVAFPQAAKKLQALASDGIMLLGASNQSGVAKNNPTMDACHDCFRETNRQLGVDVEYDFDYSPAGPVVSWHRKPMPGLGVDAIWRHELDPSKVVYVGDMTTDKTFAQRCGFRFEYAKDFFGL
jgi:HAD superfamily hydrolase (TIGR01662 family)